MKTEMDKWEEMYKPLPNIIADEERPGSYDESGGWQVYETFGPEIEYIRSQPNENIWTVVEGDDGEWYIIDGFHFVNRMFYIVTEKPYTGGLTNVLWD